MTLTERVMNKIEVVGSCWEWVGARSTSGYGQVKVAGKVLAAHRVAYELFVGPIPEGLDLDHLCRVRHCVNPEHLEPVTHQENVRRGEGTAGRNYRKTHCVHGHPLTTDNTMLVNVGGGRLGRRCLTCRPRRSL